MGTFAYSIDFGDTLWEIANQYNTSVEKIIAVNPGIEPTNLIPGEIICIPFADDDSYNNDFDVDFNHDNDDIDYITDSMVELNNHIRMLWSQHVNWFRIVAVDIIYDLPELVYDTERFLRNADDFEDLLSEFYGAENANTFKKVFKEHLVIGASLVEAAKENDPSLEAIEKAWYSNADDIAEFLGIANPYWTAEQWRNMLFEHLQLVKAEVVYLLSNNFDQAIAQTDQVELQALDMADEMVEGIVKQFKNMFD